jgi:hypothetical protein
VSVRECDLMDERPIPLGRVAEREPRGDAPPSEEATLTLAPDLGVMPTAATRGEISTAAAALDSPPLAALRRFRMEVEVVEPALRPGRGCVARLVLTYALVMAFVLALIAAFVACSGHGGGAAA